MLQSCSSASFQRGGHAVRPSRRIALPLSMGLAMIVSTRRAYCSGRPGRPGWGTWRARESCAIRPRNNRDDSLDVHHGRVATTDANRCNPAFRRSEEHTSELQSLMRISYAVFCLKKKIQQKKDIQTAHITQSKIHQKH